MSPNPPHPCLVHPIRGAAIANAKDNAPKPWTLPWGRLAHRLQQYAVRPDVADKRHLPAWIPAHFKGAGREDHDVDEVTCLVFDYDSGIELNTALAPWEGYAAAWYSTWSHSPAIPKFRLVFPLDIAIPAERWPDAWRWAASVAVGIDAKCKNASRIYFLPAVPHLNSERFAGSRTGALLRMSFRDPPPPPEPYRPPNRPSTHSQPEWQRKREIADKLKRDPEARRAAGLFLGGRVEARGVVKGVRCPGCGRPSLWWPLQPTGPGKALCEHIGGSCGATFWLDELIEGAPSGGVP